MAPSPLKLAVLWTLRETQYVVTALAALAILWTRSLHSVYIAVGATLAAFTAKALKHVLRQPRPEGGAKSSYGMPSTHSASISFFGTYLASFILLAPENIRTVHPRLALVLPFARPDEPLPDWLTWPLTASVIIGATAVCWSRVYLGHHSSSQVAAGASLGAALAVIALATWIGAEEWMITSTSSLTFSRGVRIHAEPIEQFVESVLRDRTNAIEEGREMFQRIREAL